MTDLVALKTAAEKAKDFFKRISIPAIVAFVATLIVLLPDDPNNMVLSSRDPGAFLYVGWRLLNGGVPYVDAWDHKPPLVYFVDALGIWLSPASLWGVWILQFLFIGLTIFVVYKTLEQTLGVLPALTGAVLLVSGLFTVIEQGNDTEEYALIFQALCFLGVLYARQKDYPLKLTFLLGLAGGLAFNFKQTTIGVWCAFGVLLLLDRFFQKKLSLLWKDYVALLAGWLVPSLILALYFFARHALGDFWDQAYAYNFIYVGKQSGLRHFLPVIYKGIYFLTRGGLLYFSITGWVLALIFIWIQRKNYGTSANALIILALIDFPLELVFLVVSGRSILHYYFTPLPVMAILGGMIAFTLPELIRKASSIITQPVGIALAVLTLTLVILFQLPQVQIYKANFLANATSPFTPIVQYITAHTTKQDTVLVVGAESEINFLSQRVSPTRYVYQYPLQLLGRRTMVEEYIQQIMKNRPKLIIDTDGGNGPDNSLYLTRLVNKSAIVKNGMEFLTTEYSAVATLNGCVIYQLK